MDKKGFTIVEILVVLTVIVIMIAIAIPKMKGMQDQSGVSRAKSELKALQTAVESYYINHGHVYPVTSTVIGATLSTEAARIISSTPPYDPFGTTATTEYNYQKNGNYYVIWSIGNNKNGTASVSTAGVVTTANGVVCVSNGSGC